MGLREEFAQEAPARGPGSSCQTCAFIATFPADEQVEWHALLASREQLISLFRFAQKKGLKVHKDAFARHRTNHEQPSA